MLPYSAIDQMIGGWPTRCDVTADLLTGWEVYLPHTNVRFADGQAMMRRRSHLRRLELVSQAQMDALGEWRQRAALAIDNPPAVRFNDIPRHLHRLCNHARLVGGLRVWFRRLRGIWAG